MVGDLDGDWNVRVSSWSEAFCEWRGLKSISSFIAGECGRPHDITVIVVSKPCTCALEVGELKP